MLGSDTPRTSPSRIPINPPSPRLILNTLSAMQRREAGGGGVRGVVGFLRGGVEQIEMAERGKLSKS